jgi:very-short-patch-repair endonuclease
MLREALGDVAAGCHSVLELAYLRGVERAHGLPSGRRQAVAHRRGGRTYIDVVYEELRTAIELDGRAAHPVHERFRDMDRDNTGAEHDQTTLRYGTGDVHERPCRVARQVAAMLQSRGWLGAPRRCRRPDCAVR